MKCYICESEDNVAYHEPIMGKNRKLSIKYDLRVPLCFYHHRLAHDEPEQVFNDYLKRLMQLKFEKTRTREEFIKIFGRNYL